MNISPIKNSAKSLIALCLAGIAIGSCFDFFDIAWGTGIWLGKLSLTWAVIFIVYCVLCLIFLAVSLRVLWSDATFIALAQKTISLRHRMGWLRWAFAILAFIFPAWFFQFTVWGIVFQGLYIRLLISAIALFVLCVLITDGEELISWRQFLESLILMASAFSIASNFRFITDYPFALGWSEGNRLWDYSIMFGRSRYDYPPDQEILVFLPKGRLLVGALPFLIPGINIYAVRVWVSLLTILPYLALGLAAFRSLSREKTLWIVMVFWSYIFLAQGDIHPPLVISAVLVALAWKRPLWISIPLLVLAGYYCNVSRYTWIFAPAIWIFMLEFSGAELKNGRLPSTVWIRSIGLFFFGIFGSVLLPMILKWLQPQVVTAVFTEGFSATPEGVQEQLTRQSLLWYRLWPNPTYGSGIVIGLALAIMPTMLLLFYWIGKKYGAVGILQKMAVAFPMLALLTVGLVVSVKIGGGGDLHNMDMFLIGMFFLALIVWEGGAKDWLLTSQTGALWIKAILIGALIVPMIRPLREMRSIEFGDAASWLTALTDAPTAKALDMVPARNTINTSLDVIQREVNQARMNGDILFMDQRQLLTFGYITGVPLVSEYDKKVLMDQALASNFAYFEIFYRDLRERRFSLIITQPLNTPRKGSDYGFGEENNRWVKWVTDPVLCYYEVKQTLVETNVQLLIPRSIPADCSQKP